MAQFDEDAFRADITMPTDEQVERAARLLSIANGERTDYWVIRKTEARACLIIHLNAAKWRLGL
jgi:hypothetical protein